MMQRIRPAWVGAVILVLAATTIGSAQRPNLGELMREKLMHAEDLVGAVVLGNHARIEQSAAELVRLSEATTWSPLQTPQYLNHASQFRVAAETLADEARARDIDGVSLAYMEMTLSCVQCHKHVRGARLGN